MISAHPSGGSILVTGATGLAGSAIVREFIRAGHPVRVLVRNPTRAAALRAFPTVEVVEGDLLRPQTLRGALEGVDRALLLSRPIRTWWRRRPASSMPPRAQTSSTS